MAQTAILKPKLTDLNQLANQLKVLGDVTRLELIKAIVETQDEQACVCDLTPATGLTQGTVSHHLKLLVETGLLNRTQRGKWSYYSLTKSAEKLLDSIGLDFSKTKRKKLIANS